LAALVIERRHDISVLRCLGMTAQQVGKMIVAEPALPGTLRPLPGMFARSVIAPI